MKSADRSTIESRRAQFRALHAAGTFVLPNPWDVGSARLLQQLGFQALASTSGGAAWSVGKPDYGATREAVLAHLTTLCAAVDLPVNADFESGFGANPEEVAVSVQLAIATGIAGLSIEDRKVDALGELYDLPTSLERLRAARSAIDSSGHDVLLVARTEGLLLDAKALTPAIDKLVAFADAGADCLYAPGVREPSDIATMVRAVAPKPLNVLVIQPGLSVAQLAELGVRRASVGGALARVAFSALIAAAAQIKSGSFEGLATETQGGELNRIFARFERG